MTLLDKLIKYGFDQISLNWIKSYLKNRKQYVLFKNQVSQFENIMIDVPSGSILSPLLFTIYLNDIFNLNFHGSLIGFAYGTTLIVEGKDHNELERNIDINQDIIKFTNRTLQNKIILNLNNTNYMLMGGKLKKPINMKIKINNYEIRKVYFIINLNNNFIKRVPN